MDKQHLIDKPRRELADELGDKGLVVQLGDVGRDSSGGSGETERILRA